MARGNIVMSCDLQVGAASRRTLRRCWAGRRRCGGGCAGTPPHQPYLSWALLDRAITCSVNTCICFLYVYNIMWTVHIWFTALILQYVWLYSWVRYRPPVYDDYNWPLYSEVLGFALTVVILLPLIVVPIVYFISADGTFFKVIHVHRTIYICF